MHALRARVKGGRLVLDEPTELPEGSEVPLDVAKDWDELGESERADLHTALDEAELDVANGRTGTLDEVRALLRKLG